MEEEKIVINDIKEMSNEEKKKLATNIRDVIINTVSKNGGHLASNLGVVELTIALHSVFDFNEDKVIWDVGHQSYVHKILTGRANRLDSLRSLNGLSGFPKTSESKYDFFNTGHSSTSISASLGMARARDLNNEKNHIIAIIGDGALTGGMALEALNDAGASNTNLIVILNDNEMSIEKNVGGISDILTNIRTKKIYKKSNDFFKIKLIKNVKTSKLIKRIKKSLKQLFISNMFFEDLGFTYLGPVDGNNLEDIESILIKSKEIDGPILIHCLTKKGNGYFFAEENPDKFHSIGPFDKKTGNLIKVKSKDYSKVFGEKLVSLAKDNEKIVAITAAMTSGVGLEKFVEKYPDRFFDVGIAEQHALTMAAGLAISKLIPVVSIYSSFYQRAYDQIIHDICIQKLPVIMCIDRAGLVGNDGETHQGIFDLAFLKIIPNLTIMAPKDFYELEEMLEFAINLKLPVSIRYPKQSSDTMILDFNSKEKLELGKGEYVTNFKKTDKIHLTIISIGKMVMTSMIVSNYFKEMNINCEVINVRFLKPLDENIILESLKKSNKCITVEDGCIIGGLGSSVEKLLIKNKYSDIDFKIFGYPDEFIQHGNISELEEKYKLDDKSIIEYIKNMELK